MSTKGLQALRAASPVDGLERVQLGDTRRNRRALRVAEKIAYAPSASLPAIALSDTELVPIYRLFNEADVTPAALLAPHMEETARRAALFDEVLVIHDTTEVAYTGRRNGLGPLSDRSAQGYLAHVSLVVAAGSAPLPLGVLALEQLVRPPATNEKRKRRSLLDPANEFARWHRGITTTRERLAGHPGVVHLADREGDCFELFAVMLDEQDRFVIRQKVDRRLAGSDAGSKLLEKLADFPCLSERTIDIEARRQHKAPPAKKRKHPPREARTAHLEIHAGQVEIRRPQGLKSSCPEKLALNVVHVVELQPPPGQEPVEWVLFTTEPIDTREQVDRIVDWYCRRWIIEEFFKALKTGCAVERRDFVEGHALKNVFALCVPIAWHMLVLRALARYDPGARATKLFPLLMLEVLFLGSRHLPPSQRPARNPTVSEALTAIAALGGHLRRNGEPGWLTIARGYQHVLQLARGYSLAKPRAP